MTTLPNHNERQFMQQLRGRGWVKAIKLPFAPRIIARLLERRWIESEGAGKSLTFKLTEVGLAAKMTPIPVVKWRRQSGNGNSEAVQPIEGLRLHQAC